MVFPAPPHRTSWRLLVVLTLLAVAGNAWGQTPPIPAPILPPIAPARPSGGVAVGVTVENGYLYVNAQVNGQPARFIIDTGASLMVVTPDAAKRLGLPTLEGNAQVQGTGGNVTTSLVKLDRLVIGDVGKGQALVQGEKAIVVALPEIAHADGLIGLPALVKTVVTIDWDAQQVTFTPSHLFTPPRGATVPLTLEQSSLALPVISGFVDGIPGRFEIDTGFGGALTLYPRWIKQNRVNDKYKRRIAAVTGQGIGGFSQGEITRIESFTLGPDLNAGTALRGPVASLSQQKSGADAETNTAGRIGDEILQRFVVTFDFPGNRLYLQPGPRISEPFIGPRSGLRLNLTRGVCTVVDVLPQSPAQEVGIRRGDQIIALDQTPAFRLTLTDLTKRLNATPGTVLHLIVRSGAAPARDVSLTLRELL